MSQYTELANEILTSEYGKRIYEDVAEVYGESYTALWMLQVIGLQLDKFRKFTKEFLLQITPETATWTIEFWEREYGVTPNPSWTLKQRQNQLMSTMLYRAPMTPYRLEQIASNISGLPVTVKENTAKNTFTVNVRGFIEPAIKKQIIDTIKEVKPSHLLFDVRIAMLYEVENPIYIGASIQQHLTFNVEVKN